ncbi:hypothetical protein NLB33_27015 [Mycolicibacterium smegmatis]|uniref:hypothetical protein n=1 Tax=Mycolicibacterium smegmatis TaxID=1772 RepID=UPI0020A4A116|nr:hypothetical protein [Mycolicibacterium smegmatis]MCP2626499.1 hypothetical protein [Mycolicibacterium smegmatis]
MAKREEKGSITLYTGPHSEWSATMTWYEGDDSGPSELVLKPRDGAKVPAGGISQTVLREVNITDAIDFMRRQHQEIPDAPPVDWGKIGPTLTRLSESGLTDEYLAALAWAYSEAAEERKPQERLAKLTGKSPAAIKSHLWHATRRDLLERMPGRKGGVVTPKALKLISQLEDASRT